MTDARWTRSSRPFGTTSRLWKQTWRNPQVDEATAQFACCFCLGIQVEARNGHRSCSLSASMRTPWYHFDTVGGLAKMGTGIMKTSEIVPVLGFFSRWGGLAPHHPWRGDPHLRPQLENAQQDGFAALAAILPLHKAINALNGRIDFTNKDLSATQAHIACRQHPDSTCGYVTQESLHTTQNSLSDCFNEAQLFTVKVFRHMHKGMCSFPSASYQVAVVRSDLERNVADTEA